MTAMTDVLAGDVEALRAALSDASETVIITLSLPRASAEKVLALLDAERTTGAVVVPVKELFTTTEAVRLLGLSRPTLMKLIEAGDIDHVKVGTHRRIPAQAILDFRNSRRSRRDTPVGVEAELSGEKGRVP
jgi:excisionase family DNA binding protein